ncbi:MAG: flagellar hook-length control protein FliK [Sneathiella sp.]
MDVTQSNNTKDSAFTWNANYKSDRSDDFALHLVEQENDVEPYERASNEHSSDDDPVRESRSDERSEDETRSDSQDSSNDVVMPQDQINPLTLLPVKSDEVASKVVSTTPAPQATTTTPTTPSREGGDLPSTEKSLAATAAANTTKNAAPATGQTTPGDNQTASNVPAPQTAAQPKNETPATVLPKTAEAAVTSSAAAATGAATSSVQKEAKTATPANTDVSSATKTDAASTDAPKGPIAAQQTDNQSVKPAGTQTALEKMRFDEMASVSEKEVLSAKISEMLGNAKGKISLASTGKKTNSASSPTMLSGANIAEASAPQPKATTAMATVTQSAGQADLPLIVPNGGLASSLLMPATTGDPALSANAGLTGGAISGIDSTASNSASQANMASRASAQAGSPAEQVSSQISTAAKDGVDRIKVQLSPAELGRVDIKLEISSDGRVLASISADNQESLDLLKQDSRQLEQALKDAGFDTGSDSLSFSLNQGQGDQENSGEPATANLVSEDEDISQIDLANMEAAYGVSDNGNLDIQV